MSCVAMSGSRDGRAAAAGLTGGGGGARRRPARCGPFAQQFFNVVLGQGLVVLAAGPGRPPAGGGLRPRAGRVLRLAEEPLDLVLAHQGFVVRHRNPFLAG